MGKQPVYHVLAADLPGVECWNHTDGREHTLPAGTRLEVNHPNSRTHMTCTVVDADGKSVEFVPQGYRFIIPNRVLGLQDRPFDLVDALIAYESGESTPAQDDRLFRELKGTRGLQGHYGRAMAGRNG